MKKILVALALLVAAVLQAQEAKVISLQEKDSRIAKEAWENLQQAQQTWEHVQDLLNQKYLQVPWDDPQRGNHEIANNVWPAYSGLNWVSTVSDCHVLQLNPQTDERKARCSKEEAQERLAYDEARKKARYYRQGWENGFQFSYDFKYIVPKPTPVIDYPNRMFLTTPAVAN